MHDHDAETAVLAACLTSRVARDEAKRHLTGSDFDAPPHEAIWDAMGRLDHHRKEVDPTTVLALIRSDRAAMERLPEVITAPAVAENVAEYAAIVRGWAVKRRLVNLAKRVEQRAANPDANAIGLAATIANEFAAVRDSGITDDVTSVTMAELLAEPDDEPDWLVPGLLERRDRLILTGDEGLGKSYMLRQIAMSAAAGIDPWDASKRIPPIKVAIFDVENSANQVKRAARPLAEFVTRHGRDDAMGRVNIRCSQRIDITRDRDLASVHHELDAIWPDLVVIGPLYRLSPRAIQTDDEAAPLLAALDTIRDRDCALLIEAHSGHAIGKGGQRDMRPRGSSALLGWPEFGYGLRDIGTTGYCDMVAWRGNRSERDWPQRLRRADGFRWIPHDDLREVPSWATA